MMNGFLISLMIIAGFLTILSLIMGVVAMIKGGEFNQKYGNKLMQMRVLFQGIALLILAFLMMSKS
jgi:hypothetical protein